ncbi:CHRD domain-containing protein [Polaribacter litorisediminis]|uniref:CHRD domain-containing protein n=1 Tax=Polaribacter litorisediminis TaxID=1908341 RepID=UPI001CBFC247|nr:CHRD domain-containing protein [Polaribacter litorisediminis]
MKKIKLILLLITTSLVLYNCNDDDDNTIPVPSDTLGFDLPSKDVDGISGGATFIENSNGSITAVLHLSGTPDGGSHPAHIHFNTAAEGGGIALSFNPVNGSDGQSVTTFSTLDDGTPITLDELMNFDGYINVHLSADQLGTIVAQGDIGQNDLNGNSKTYDLGEKAAPGISGSVMFAERNNGEVLSQITLAGTPEGGVHPAHIHANTAVEGGGILLSFSPINGDTGMSATNITSFDDGTAFAFSDIETLDAYVNVHLSASELGTIVAQGDIGQNDLTGSTKSYDLGEKAVAGISGTVSFSERVNGEALAEIMLSGTPAGGSHPAHIHANTAVEGGGILFSFAPVNGDTGMSATNVASFDDGSSFGYANIEGLDGYVNVHLSATQLSTIVAQGDIGQNDLTGMTTSYDLGEKAVAGISGTVTFSERKNGEALAEIMLIGTPAGGLHPAHIHANTAVEGGGILFSFTPVNGDTGMSATNVASFDDGSSFGYANIEGLDGYVNVHLSSTELGVIVAQGDIGQNDLTGMTTSYDLGEKAVPGISGTVTFSERKNGEALAEIMLIGTPAGGLHPAHIHANTAVEGGGILFSFTPVNGDTGMSATNVASFDDGSSFGYANIEGLDGYVNVHLSSTELGVIVAQGDIGQNDLTGDSKMYTLAEKDVAGISGTATFYKRVNGSALAVLNVQNTPVGGIHPAHIHQNDVATGGGIAFTFNAVDGTTGMSTTQVSSLDDNTAITYEDILTYNGYINVHLSASELGTIVAQGNIGSNE